MMSSTATDNSSMYRRPSADNWGPRPPQPYNGAAPPIPANLTQSIPAAAWAAGCWQPNPHYNPRAYGAQPAFIQWIPAQQWQLARAQHAAQMAHQQQQQAQNYNPYRKKVKPPSAEYLASSLSDNPLGLENMDPTKSLYNDLPPEAIAGLDDGSVNPHTPWIWKPQDLQDPAPPQPQEAAESSSESSSEDDTDDDDEDSPNDAPAKSTSPPPRESFTSPGPLQPTFSINIVRTPDHYRGSGPGSSSIESRMQNLNINAAPSRQPLSRHSSMPQSSYSSASISSTSSSSTSSSGSITGQHLSDEPGSLLSPLIIANTPKPSTSARQLSAASSGSLGRHSSVPAVLSTIPESTNVRTSSYPTPSSTSNNNSSSSASAYAASIAMTHRRHSQDESRPSSTSRPSSRQPSPTHTPPPTLSYPQQRSTYPTVSSNNTSTPNARHHHASYPPPSSAPPYPSSTPVKVPPNTSGPYPYGFPPNNPAPNPSSSTTPARQPFMNTGYPSGLGSQTTQVFYHTPPNSAPVSNSVASPFYPAQMSGGTPTPSSTRKQSRTRDREREMRGSVDVSEGPSEHRSSIDKDRGRESWGRLPAPNFGGGGGGPSSANALSPGSSYPAYMSGPPASHPPAPHPNPSSSSTANPNPYPTPPSGGSGASPAGPPSGYSPTKDPGYQYHYQYSQQQQRNSNGGTPTTGSNTGPGTSGKRQMRKGYWNRRGDHLTPTGYVVYAPPKLAYPPDLAHYPLDPESVPPEKLEALAAAAASTPTYSASPSKSNDLMNDERVGYLNEHGHFAPWAKRPELPESLPRHGREAEKPYEKFVEFVVV